MNDDLDLADDLTSPLDDFTSPKNELDPSKSMLNQAPPFDFLEDADDDGDDNMTEVEPSVNKDNAPTSSDISQTNVKMEMSDEPMADRGGNSQPSYQTATGGPASNIAEDNANANNNSSNNDNGFDDDKLDDDDDDDFIVENSDSKTPGEILDEFCLKFQDINTTLPDSVINHYMKKAGFIVNDRRLIKIISIASQKFIAEIVNDIMQHHKLKTKSAMQPVSTAAATTNPGANKTGQAASTGTSSTGASSGGGTAANSTASANQQPSSVNNLTLTLEDLTQVLNEYGINVKKPYYFM